MVSLVEVALTLGDTEMLVVLFVALVHDYDHTGHTTNFHIRLGTQSGSCTRPMYLCIVS